MISDAGLGNALIIKRDFSWELELTIFGFSLGMSLGLASLVSLPAWPVGRLFSEPKLTPGRQRPGDPQLRLVVRIVAIDIDRRRARKP